MCFPEKKRRGWGKWLVSNHGGVLPVFAMWYFRLLRAAGSSGRLRGWDQRPGLHDSSVLRFGWT